jgi:hypothetical protein
MSVVSASNIITTSITQVDILGVNSGISLQGGVLTLKSQFGNAASIDNFNLLHATRYNFAASTPELPDLTSLLDQKGNAIGFAQVLYFLYRIQSTNAAFTIAAGGAVTNPWNGFLVGAGQMTWQTSTAKNDGFMILQAPNGMAVNSGSKVLKLDPGTNAVGFVDIIIAGY